MFRNLIIPLLLAAVAPAASADAFHRMAAFYDWQLDSAVSLEYHRPDYCPLNPVLRADRPWELNATGDPYAAPFSGGVWLDGGVLRMWYSAGGGRRDGLVTCYAESADGVNWVKPELDIVPGTNIVDTLEHDCVTVMLDRHDPDPSRRYKMFNVAFNKPSSVSMVLKYSPDGIHWSEPAALSGELYDRCSAYFDERRGNYVLSLKTIHPRYRRARAYLAGKDPEELVSLAHRVYPGMKDRNIRYWFNADSLDQRHPLFPDLSPQIYNHDAISYGEGVLGQFVVWKGPENGDCNRLNIQKRNEICLGWSDDGFNWKRPDRRAFIAVNDSVEGAWNAGNIQSVAGCPVAMGDSLYFYFSGRYESKPRHASNFATGLARLRRDGFASLTAGPRLGTALLPPLPDNPTPSGKLSASALPDTIYVNATSLAVPAASESALSPDSARPEIEVEFLLPSGLPVARYSLPADTPADFDTLRLPLLRTSDNVTIPLSPANLALRLTLRNVRFYSLSAKVNPRE